MIAVMSRMMKDKNETFPFIIVTVWEVRVAVIPGRPIAIISLRSTMLNPSVTKSVTKPLRSVDTVARVAKVAREDTTVGSSAVAVAVIISPQGTTRATLRPITNTIRCPSTNPNTNPPRTTTNIIRCRSINPPSVILPNGVTTTIVATPHKIATKSVNGSVAAAVTTVAKEAKEAREDITAVALVATMIAVSIVMMLGLVTTLIAVNSKSGTVAREVKVAKVAVVVSVTKSVTPCANRCTPHPCRTTGRFLWTLWCRRSSFLLV
mmetsp:Transcript_21221/g.23778  ORF Transcript_21221/g.23778 Transcript_21221/m.23778 type:complete len:264 (+) Transcript_21221:343-1134(+)